MGSASGWSGSVPGADVSAEEAVMAYLLNEFWRLCHEAMAEMFEAGQRDAVFVSRTINMAARYKHRNR